MGICCANLTKKLDHNEANLLDYSKNGFHNYECISAAEQDAIFENEAVNIRSSCCQVNVLL